MEMTDKEYQGYILQKVARTFALTIPQMPVELRETVANAYLLCRITDTIEDATGLTSEQKLYFSQIFAEVIKGCVAADAFAEALYPLLSKTASVDEQDLVKNTARIIRLTQSFPSQQQMAIQRCVTIMASGMAYFQIHKSSSSLEDLQQLNRYCYYVAGVVGEMLTELCCLYSARISAHRKEMMRLAVSFGQGLQMINILKDIWEDKQRGVCWLPGDIFKECGYDLHCMGKPDHNQAAFTLGLEKLIANAHGHLLNALAYVKLIPKQETGLRKFCLWAIGMAILTLRRIWKNPGFRSGSEVKISRRHVAAVVSVSGLAVRSDNVLRILFRWLANPLPTPIYDHSSDENIRNWQSIVSRL